MDSFLLGANTKNFVFCFLFSILYCTGNC